MPNNPTEGFCRRCGKMQMIRDLGKSDPDTYIGKQSDRYVLIEHKDWARRICKGSGEHPEHFGAMPAEPFSPLLP